MAMRPILPHCGVLLCALAMPAQAQYREGMPEVMAAPAVASADPGADTAAFGAAYRKAGKPRMAVLWNRELTDTLSTGHDHVAQLTQAGQGAAVTAVGEEGRSIAQVAGASSVTTLRVGERQAEPDAQRTSLAENEDWPLMTAFNTRLRDAGVTLVDRSVAMRAKAAAGSAEQRRDVQTLETQALRDKADLLVEVLQTPDAKAPFGVLFRVEVKRISSGELVASLVSDGKAPERGPGRFVAGAKGFVREAAPEQTLAQAGDVVAAATLRALAAYWN